MSSNAPWGNTPEPSPTNNEEDPLVVAEERVGFAPDLVVDVVGTTFSDETTGISRQVYLAEALSVLRNTGSLPIKIEHQTDNKYDDYAAAVIVPTKTNKEASYEEERQVGFLPRKFCWSCFQSSTGKNARNPLCVECGEAFSEDNNPFNKYILDKLKDGKIVGLGTVWITEKTEQKNAGMRLAIKFSPQ